MFDDNDSLMHNLENRGLCSRNFLHLKLQRQFTSTEFSLGYFPAVISGYCAFQLSFFFGGISRYDFEEDVFLFIGVAIENLILTKS